MEATGKIIAILTAEGGVSKRTGNPWKKQGFVLETIENYPKKIAFEVFGEDRIKQFNLQLEEVVTIHIDIDSSEWNGKWYPKVNCFNVTRAGQQQPQAVAAAPQPAAQAQQTATQTQAAPQPQMQGGGTSNIEPPPGGSDDLPF